MWMGGITFSAPWRRRNSGTSSNLLSAQRPTGRHVEMGARQLFTKPGTFLTPYPQCATILNTSAWFSQSSASVFPSQFQAIEPRSCDSNGHGLAHGFS